MELEQFDVFWLAGLFSLSACEIDEKTDTARIYPRSK